MEKHDPHRLLAQVQKLICELHGMATANHQGCRARQLFDGALDAMNARRSIILEKVLTRCPCTKNVALPSTS